MNKTLMLAFACVLFFTACGKLAQEDSLVKQKYPVQFNIQPSLEILPFSALKSTPEAPPEPDASNPGQGEEGLLFTRIEYMVYNETTQKVVKLERLQEGVGNEDFGSFLYDELEKGSYKVCVLAHSDKEAKATENSLLFEQISDAFYASKSIEVDGISILNVDLTLQRVVSRVELSPTDAIPTKATSCHIEISGLYKAFDILTGEAANTPVAGSIEHTFTEANKTTGYTPSFLTLVPEGGPKISSVTMQILEGTTLLHTLSVSNIPLFKNRTTRYTGKLYSPGTSEGQFSLLITNGGKWDEDYEYDPDNTPIKTDTQLPNGSPVRP